MWFNFIVNTDLDTWAIIVTYEEDFSDLSLVTPGDDYCYLEFDETYEGVYVSEYWEGSCPFIEEYGWTYASLTYGADSDGVPESITGPWGNQWLFKNETEMAEEHEDWLYEFYDLYYGSDDYDDEYYSDEPALFVFIVEEQALNTWGFLVAYEEDMSDLLLVTSTEEYCSMAIDESY